MSDERAYWELPEIISWVVTREHAQVEEAHRSYEEDKDRNRLEASLVVLYSHLGEWASRVFPRRIAWDEVIEKITNSHSEGKITLSWSQGLGHPRYEIPRDEILGFTAYSDSQGVFLADKRRPVGSRLWHHIRALSSEVRAAFPRPSDPVVYIEGETFENEPTPYATLWACTVRIAGTEDEFATNIAAEKMRTALTSRPDGAANGFRNGAGERLPIPAIFWLDAHIDVLRGTAFDVPPGMSVDHHAKTGWEKVGVSKQFVEELITRNVQAENSPPVVKRKMDQAALESWYKNTYCPKMKRLEALPSLYDDWDAAKKSFSAYYIPRKLIEGIRRNFAPNIWRSKAKPKGARTSRS